MRRLGVVVFAGAVALVGAAGCSTGGYGPAKDGSRDGVDALADAVSRDSHASEDATRDLAPGSDARDAGSGDGDTDGSVCDIATRAIALDGDPIAGVLEGPSRNAGTTCPAAATAPGPDAFFSLVLDAFTTVDLRVDAPVDTFIVVRAGCDGDEIGCGDERPPGGERPGGASDGGDGPSDAAADASSSTRTARLRVALPRGRYTVVVDSFPPVGRDSAPFTLTAAVVPPASNASCAAATMLGAATPAVHAELDLAGPPATGCGGTAAGALFYAVDVPAGDHLTVLTTETSGDRPWLARLAAFDACGTAGCLAQGSAASGTSQRLDWFNNGSTTRHVMLAVAPDAPVTGAALDLDVGVTNVLATCARPTSVQDGTLANQSLSGVAASANQTCDVLHEPALYYAATVLPTQMLAVTATMNGGNPAGVRVAIRTACDGLCSTPSNEVEWVNGTSRPETVLVEVTGNASGPFDLHVLLPPPFAGVSVTPTSGLVTTEGGAQATFDVVLTAQPSATVSVGVASRRPGEGTASPSTLVFDASDWDRPQTVTVTGTDDAVSDGPQAYTVVTAPAVSADPAYDGLDPDDVSVTNLDDDPSLVVEGADDLVTAEDGTSIVFTARLAKAPTGDVIVPIASTDAGEAAVSPTSLTFTPASWDVPQPVTVTGVDDAVADGTRPFTIDFGPLSSADTRYDGLVPAALTGFNKDDDFAPIAGKVISGASLCAVPAAPSQFPFAADELGGLYVVALCDDRLTMFASTDGGASFSAPIRLPAPAGVSDFTVAAGRGGTVLVPFTVAGRAVELARTTDAGATWTVRPLALVPAVQPRIAAARDTVVAVVGLPASNGPSPGSLVLRSQDAGASFTVGTTLPHALRGLIVERDGRSVWTFDEEADVLTSRDAGATFTPFANAGTYGNGWFAVGTNELFGISPVQIVVTSLADGSQLRKLDGPMADVLAVTLDDADVLTIVSSNVGPSLLGTRIPAGASSGSTAYVGPTANLVGALSLSRHATALASSTPSKLTFSLATWP